MMIFWTFLKRKTHAASFIACYKLIIYLRRYFLLVDETGVQIYSYEVKWTLIIHAYACCIFLFPRLCA